MVISTADRIKKLRELRGMSQAKLAKQLNITRSSVNAWEMGVSIPSTQKIVELALLFNTTTDFILGFEGGFSLNLESFTEREIALIYQLTNYMAYTKHE